jgi:hypothetical protein
MRYWLINLYWLGLPTGQTAFWPVLARPGRQRHSRVAFDNQSDAILYGLRLKGRYNRFWEYCQSTTETEK